MHGAGRFGCPLKILIVVVVLGWGTCGCETSEMWDRATQTELFPSRIRGFVTSPSDRQMPAAVVVSYAPISDADSSFDPVLVVPWNAAINGPTRDEAMAPTDRDFERGGAAAAGADFRKDDPQHSGVRWVARRIGLYGADPCILRADPFQGDPPHPAKIDQRDLVLFLPATANRPATNLAGAQARAALLTPVTVFEDVVLVPIAYSAWAGGTMICMLVQ